MLTIYSTPELNSPVLLCGFSGWADAASAASGALRYLQIKRPGRRIASFDADSIYNYTSTRPLTLFDGQGRRKIEWPSLEMSAIEVPEARRDLVVLLGPEPDLRWRDWVRTLFDYARQLQVSAVLTFGAFLAQVHFAGPVSLTGISFDPWMKEQLRQLGIEDSDYQGPTGITTVILREAAERGIPAASVWAAAPSYLSSTSNPKLAAALLGIAERLIGQELWKDELETAGREMERKVQDALRSRPDLVDFLKQLRGESAEDAADEETNVESQDAPQTDQFDELPSSAEVLRDLEEHLRRLKGDSGEGSGGDGE